MVSTSAWPDRVAASTPRTGRVVAAGIGLSVAAATMLLLPPAKYRAQAIVAVTDPSSPFATLLPRTAAETAVSKPVILRAAESLIDTGLQAPEPDLMERLALAVTVGGTQATGKAARLAADVSYAAAARPGALPGSLEIIASSDDGERAARVATAIADALVADQDDASAKARRAREVEAASRVARLKADALAARRRLSSLGGVEAEPEQLRAAATAQTAVAKARVDTIRAILSSGSPPLSDRRDVPTAIEALQATYLDLSRQLAKARETLGDRHTTIISLQAELKHAAANLTAEWRRLGKLAEGEFATARDRETSLRKAENPADASRRAAIEEARRNVLAADDAVTRAQAGRSEASSDERGYRLLARPIVPTSTVGLPLPARALLALLAGIAAFWLIRRSPRVNLSSLVRHARPTLVSASTQNEPALEESESPVVIERSNRAATRLSRGQKRAAEIDPGEELIHTMYDLLPELEGITPAFGPVPTIVVAANEAGMATTSVALALGRAMAEAGHRALIVEAARPQPDLAAAASETDEPILVDLYGTLRVGLRAETKDGLLYLAPSLKQGARIASALARGSETRIFEDIGTEFDLVILDGGEAEVCAAEGWGGDVYLRVGRFESRRHDAQLAETFDVPQDMILGTIVSSSFRQAKAAPVGVGRAPASRSSAKASPRDLTSVRSAPARSIAPRRTAGRR